MLALTACKSAEERAEEHYQNALTLLAEDDHERAMIELRNVLKLDFSHREARHELADLLLDHFGRRQQAYGEYLRLVEQYPDDLKARIILAETAFGSANWDEVERHGSKAAELAPDDIRVRAIGIARAYRAAALEDDRPALREQARAAEQMLAELPDSEILRNLLIDANMREGDFQQALQGIDWMLERNPEDMRYWRQRLSLLAKLEDAPGIETQLLEMIERFPDDLNNKRVLIRFYMTRGETDKAEEFLRAQVAAAPGEPGPRLDLIRFLAEVRSASAAFAEIDLAIADQSDPVPFRAVRAGLDFEQGNRDKAVAELEEVLQGAEASEQTRNIKVTLARMLVTMNNNVGARARVEEVLAEDPTNAEALKMRAAWLIEDDDTDAAIAALRTALDEAPEDAAAMTLMAQAYVRAGRPQLARDFLALAVETSGNAPEETIRYARLLVEEESYLAAEDILLPALRIAPKNIDILVTLGQLYLRMDDLGRAEQVVRTLRGLDDQRAQQAANGLEAERLNREAGPEEAMGYLEALANSADATLSSKISVLRARVGTGNIDGALDMARELTAENPDNPALKRVLATTEALSGNLDRAEELYRELIELNPNVPVLWVELSRLKIRQGDPQAASATVDEGLAKFPQDGNLLWAKASYLEREGDIEGAIEIYETLYENNSNSVVVANNLASLLSTYREDDETLERAWVVARRFRDTDVPAVQDTYGWIEQRRGNSEEALRYLEPAARGLPNDPIVQYHLGRVYQALGRNADALKQFERAAELAGPADSRAQIEDARTQISELKAAQEASTDQN